MNIEQFFSEEVSSSLKTVVFLIPNWKWLGLGIALTIGLFLQPILSQFFKWLKTTRLFSGKGTSLYNYTIEQPLHGPVAWILTSLIWLAAIDALKLGGNLEKYLKMLVQLTIAFFVIRFIYLMVNAFGRKMTDLAARTPSSLDDQLVPLVTRTLKFLVVVLGFLTVLQNFGVNVVSVLAGLGLGGLALALAAQDTAANLFGSVTILMDQPFQIGDHVKIGSHEGTVEDIGFRSTRIRTFYRSVVTIPNSIVAKEYIDNLGQRNARRVRHVLGLTYDTPEASMKEFMDKVRYLLVQHPDILKSPGNEPVVRFNAMGDFNLQILVQFFLPFSDMATELRVQEEILFDIMQTAEKLKVEFAFPTQTQIFKGVPDDKTTNPSHPI